jgi:P27 family predicted phage terminase small subunit
MPTNLKLLHGERRDSRLNRAAPKPRSNRPVMPADMSDDAKRVWRRKMWDMGQTGVLTIADEDTFRAYCETVDRYRQGAVALAASGPLVVDLHHGGMLVKNPLHQVVRDDALLMRALARELGFTPAAREGLKMSEAESDDPTEKWLKDRG